MPRAFPFSHDMSCLGHQARWPLQEVGGRPTSPPPSRRIRNRCNGPCAPNRRSGWVPAPAGRRSPSRQAAEAAVSAWRMVRPPATAVRSCLADRWPRAAGQAAATAPGGSVARRTWIPERKVRASRPPRRGQRGARRRPSGHRHGECRSAIRCADLTVARRSHAGTVGAPDHVIAARNAIMFSNPGIPYGNVPYEGLGTFRPGLPMPNSATPSHSAFPIEKYYGPQRAGRRSTGVT